MGPSETVEKEILASSNLPPCPQILSGLTQALQESDTTVSDLSQLISSDDQLTQKILRIVNSPYYGLPRTVNTLDEAAFRIDFRELWSLAVAAQVYNLYGAVAEVSPPSGDTLWEHSLRVGLLARRLAIRAHADTAQANLFLDRRDGVDVETE